MKVGFHLVIRYHWSYPTFFPYQQQEKAQGHSKNWIFCDFLSGNVVKSLKLPPRRVVFLRRLFLSKPLFVNPLVKIQSLMHEAHWVEFWMEFLGELDGVIHQKVRSSVVFFADD